MKKPNIEVKPAPNYPQMGDHFWVNEKALTQEQIKNRYIHMIDALIGARFFIKVCLKNFKREGLPESIKYAENELAKIEEALKKAGVTEL